MAITLSVRIVSFISKDWVTSPFPAPIGYRSEFKGDDRKFNKDVSASYRTAQQINATFTNTGGTYTAYRNTGITTERSTNISTGNYVDSTGQADPNGITASVDTSYLLGGNSDFYKFVCDGDAADPLIPGAPAVNYHLFVSIHKSGLISIEGLHDGYPSFEVYASVNGGTWQNIYLFEEKTLLNLFPPMEINVYETRNII